MQKKIIALAIASVFAAPALALADAGNIVIYGQANVSYDMIDTGDGVPGAVGTAGTSSNRVTSNSSRFGIKGSEDLGDGLSAIWQIETAIRIDAGPKDDEDDGNSSVDGFGDRNTFAGLSSASLGTLILGHVDTPYKASTEKLDVFKDGVADYNSLMGLGGAANFDQRSSDIVSYTTPNFNNGFAASVAYTNQSESNTLNIDTEVSGTSLAGSYSVAPFYATVAYESHNIKPNVGVSTKEKATKIGLGYTMDSVTLGAVYETTKDDFAAAPFTDQNGHKAYYVSAKFDVNATDAIKVAYTKIGEIGNDPVANVNTGAKQISVGYDHALSKRTAVYALYTKLDNDNNASFGLAGGGDYNGNAGASPRAISIGMKHSF